jgi:hypoxanthine phosphoribosyltransferase
MDTRQISLEEVNKIINEFIMGNGALLKKIDFVIGVSRGGLIPAALLSSAIDKPLATAYINKFDQIFFDRAAWVKGKNVLVVDDIVRSGKTLWLLQNYLKENIQSESLSFFTLFKVIPLLKKHYEMSIFSQEVNHNMVFPWDHNNQ